MKKMSRVVFAGVIALALMVALVGGVAQAQTPTPPTTAPSAPPTNPLDQTFWQSLASRLGITLDRLTQAVKDAARDTVTSAVQGGSLTQDQANQITPRIDQWQPGQGLPFGRGGGHGGPGGRGGHDGLGGPGGQAVMDAAAQALGMTSADLMTELRAGRTLTDLAEAKGVDANTVKQAIVNAKKAEIDAAVQAGRLTADQATQMKQRIDQEAASQDLNSLLRGGRGGRDGFQRGAPGTPPQRPQPSTTPSARPGA